MVRRTGLANEKDFLLLEKYFVEKAYKNESLILIPLNKRLLVQNKV